MQPRPFTVIGGFLGAGKTTLVNRLLEGSAGVRYAVLVNDFGAVNVDAGLIARHDGQTMALTNGCICCSLADGFITTMLRLMQAPERFDHVIVEASGVALPDPIMDVARLDPLLAQDAVVVLVDAETLTERLADRHVGDVVAGQIAQADIVLVTKLDLAGEGALDDVSERIRALNATAVILPDDRTGPSVATLLGATPSDGQGARPGAGHVHASFHTLTLRAVTPVPREAFERFATALPSSVLRGKGRVALKEGGGLLWHRVGTRMEYSALADRPEVSELVLIAPQPLENLPQLPPGMLAVR